MATGRAWAPLPPATSRRAAPWENPYVKSFNARLRDELLDQEQFDSLLEAQVLVEAWRIEYNTFRPHSALGGLNPRRVHPPADDPTPALITAGSGPPSLDLSRPVELTAIADQG